MHFVLVLRLLCKTGRTRLILIVGACQRAAEHSGSYGQDYLTNVEGNNLDIKLARLGVNVSGWGFSS